MIKVRDLTKKFDEKIVLSNINCDFEIGMNLIYGNSGSGKSTFLNILGLLDNFNNGYLEFGQSKIFSNDNVDYAKLRSKFFGYIFQSYYLIPNLSVIENVIVPTIGITTKKEAITKAEYLLEKVGMIHMRNSSTFTLSGGEQQRVAIARSMVNDPSIVLADEPCANLDEKNTKLINELLSEFISHDKCLILVSHQNLYKELADRVFLLENKILTKTK